MCFWALRPLSSLRQGHWRCPCCCCSGILVYEYQGDYTHSASLMMTAEQWANYRSMHCGDWQTSAEIGRGTNLGSGPIELGTTPFFGAWEAGQPYYSFSDPLPDPSPRERATDPYNQLAWYENNIWAFSLDSGNRGSLPARQRLPADSRQYGPNTIAANVAAVQSDNSMSQCSMLFNEHSVDSKNVSGAVKGEMIVNTKQAIACEYPNNEMAISVSVPVAEVFGFKNGQLGVEIQSSKSIWFPGALAGIVNVTLTNTGSMAQVVSVISNKTSCCFTSPSLVCNILVDEFPLTGYLNPPPRPIFVGSNGSGVVQFRLYLRQHGEGYCNVSFHHLYFDGKGMIGNETSEVTGQFTFSAPVVLGPPVTFSVTFFIYLLNMERSIYFEADTSTPKGGNSVTDDVAAR